MKTLQTIILIFFAGLNAFAWGGKGHAIVAKVAQEHLTPEAKKKVDKILEGKSMVYYSSWMDNLRGIPEFDYTRTWHYLNIDPGFTYQTSEKEPAGDVYNKTIFIIDELKSGKLNDSTEQVYLKMLVHMMGDLHCPMHAGYKKDLGGNRFSVQWFGNDTNLHSIWDSKLIESARPWSYSEWQENIDVYTPKQIAKIASQKPEIWLEENLVNRDKVYLGTQEGANLSYDYINSFTKLCEEQLVKAGYRLAYVLNDIYGSKKK